MSDTYKFYFKNKKAIEELNLIRDESLDYFLRSVGITGNKLKKKVVGSGREHRSIIFNESPFLKLWVQFLPEEQDYFQIWLVLESEKLNESSFDLLTKEVDKLESGEIHSEVRYDKDYKNNIDLAFKTYTLMEEDFLRLSDYLVERIENDWVKLIEYLKPIIQNLEAGN